MPQQLNYSNLFSLLHFCFHPEDVNTLLRPRTALRETLPHTTQIDPRRMIGLPSFGTTVADLSRIAINHGVDVSIELTGEPGNMFFRDTTYVGWMLIEKRVKPFDQILISDEHGGKLRQARAADVLQLAIMSALFSAQKQVLPLAHEHCGGYIGDVGRGARPLVFINHTKDEHGHKIVVTDKPLAPQHVSALQCVICAS